MSRSSILLSAGPQQWKIAFEQITPVSSQIGLFLRDDTGWARYGTALLNQESNSCTVSIERTILPYAILKSLFQVIDNELQRLGITILLAMDEARP